MTWIQLLNKSVEGITYSDAKQAIESMKTHRNDNEDTYNRIYMNITLLLAFCDELDRIIDETPADNRNANNNNNNNSTNQRVATLEAPVSRFGNVTFRTFLLKMRSASVPFLAELLKSSKSLPSVANEKSSEWKLNPIIPENHNIHKSHQHHTHVTSRIPEKVLQSMRARGELVDNGVSTEQKEAEVEVNSKHESSITKNISSTLALSENEHVLLQHLSRYFHSSFGDERRIDYGTGHEMNFLCFLHAICACGVFHDIENIHQREHANNTNLPDLMDIPASVLQALALVVFPRYLKVLHRLQEVYWLEPAGSRGVWGLDDYSFLPFLFGSAQLIPHKHLKPKSVRYSETVEAMAPDYLYFESISFILKMKSCSFVEHSPMLYDITACASWKQVNNGLVKMYEAEVLKKYAVVQHFIFSPFFPPILIKQIDTSVVAPEPPPCCSDTIHFPSALAGNP
jgi:hypothetical protein